MPAAPRYIIPDLIGSLGTRSFMLVWLCVVFPMTANGDPAVGVINGDVFMSWGIQSSNTSLDGGVFNPKGLTVIYFPENNGMPIVSQAFSNRVKDNGSSRSLGRISFRLLNLTVTDAGRYYYRLIKDSVMEAGQDLVIAGNPANVSVMEVSDPVENEMWKMRCSAQSTSVPLGMELTMYYQWKREKANIIASERYSFSSDQSNLTINPLKRQDAGTFVCEAWEHVGAVSQSAPFSLKVIYGPDPGSIHFSPNSSTSHELTESSSLMVNCYADCFPDCQYRWTGPGGNIVSNTGLLYFMSIGRNQSGQYTCTALNSRSSSKTATAAISVYIFCDPETPAKFHITDVQEKQVTLQWLSGDHRGFDQTFVIQISMDNITWTNSSLINGGKKEGWFSATVTGLKPNTAYYFRLYSFNVNGGSGFAGIDFATRTLKESASSLDIGASIGIGFGGFFLGVVGTISVIIIWKRITANPKYSSTSEADMSTDMQTYANTGVSSSPAPSLYEQLQHDCMEKAMYDRICDGEHMNSVKS